MQTVNEFVAVGAQFGMGKNALADRLISGLNKKYEAFELGSYGEYYKSLAKEKPSYDDMLVEYQKWISLSSNSGKKWAVSSFAAPVKEIYCRYFGVTLEFVEEWKRSSEIPPGMLMTVRQGLQFIGDGFRQIKPTIWIDKALEGRRKCFADLRYTNEAMSVKARGGFTILLYRPGHLNQDPNGSESELRPLLGFCMDMGDGFLTSCSGMPEGLEHFDYFLRNDGTKEELLAKADALVPVIEGHFSGGS